MTGLVAARVEASSPYDGIYLKDFAAFSDAGCALAPTPPPASPCSLVHDYLYTGAPLSPPLSNATTVTACCAACRAHPGVCVAFALHPIGAEGGFSGPEGQVVCQLLKAVGGGNTVKGAVSGSPTSHWGYLDRLAPPPKPTTVVDTTTTSAAEVTTAATAATATVYTASTRTPTTTRPTIKVLGAVELLMVEQTPVVYKGKLLRFESIRSEYYGNNGTYPYFRFTDAVSEMILMVLELHGLNWGTTAEDSMSIVSDCE